MYLEKIDLSNYRNYTHVNLKLSPGINIISGANAQGKTNLVEAIYYLSIGKTFRLAKDEQLALWGQTSFQISGDINSRRGKTTILIRYDKETKPPKEVIVGGLSLNKVEELGGYLTSVLFSPDSMSIVKGSPQERRNFLDYDISQVSLAYVQDLSKYRRLLAQRNALLKKLNFSSLSNEDKKSRLEIWDQQLIEIGSKIITKRLSTVEKLNPLARLAQRKLTSGKENIEITYLKYFKNKHYKTEKNQGLSPKDFLMEAKNQSLMEDLRLGTTQWGPHRDDIAISLDGIDLKLYGSQGQQRTGVLALKLAELEFFRGESGEYPILLLDDVMSELDQNRQNQLLNFINEKAIQSLITATDDKSLSLIEKRQIKRFYVNRGEIKEF